ncbi:hypothetical protein EDC14_10092 [Hydrogenispora ethanolica]|uniref:Knr4/Smi1-like domain-containing protein n=1 Tax=Hydrogenispora ethanolica TaxID=1082276 RepID=A0A4R1RVK5_HYDET|nr:SMI1/KNR4 family protein [Hydrogenispora ethanolica]TCL70685.1 hypothetical protein EDC14_10092 [Hydrogenispora ethanolica]
MTVDMMINELKKFSSTRLYFGATDKLVRNIEEKNIWLPQKHQELLAYSNGIEVYGGYFRLFGLDPKNDLEMINWNDYQKWKFAWLDKVADFWCFGETAWGDQYAYRYDELLKGNSSKVYFLYAATMEAEMICNDFEEFFEKEFLRCAIAPYDVMISIARKRLGDLDNRFHIVYNPSLLLGGHEEIENVMKLPATTAMIFNGDLATQLTNEPMERAVKEIQIYQDERGRNRIRVIWAK